MQPELQVTYRRGRALAAYYRLLRGHEDRVATTRAGEAGLVVDLTADGRPLGIEITEPRDLDIDAFNRLLISLGLDPVEPAELAPLSAA